MTAAYETQLAPGLPATENRNKPFYLSFWFQVLVAVALAIGLGYFSPARALP